MAKPRNWRRYFWYRPQRTIPMVRFCAEDIERQAGSYVRWLAAHHGISFEAAGTRIEQHRMIILLAAAQGYQQHQPAFL